MRSHSPSQRLPCHCLTPIVHIRRRVIISVSHLSCQEKAHTCSNQFSSIKYHVANYMWQYWVENERYSFAYFDRITALETRYL